MDVRGPELTQRPSQPPSPAKGRLQPLGRRAEGPSPPAASVAEDETTQDREILFSVLSHCIGWIEAAEATEAALLRFGGYVEAIAAEETELAALPAMGEAGAAALKAIHAAAVHMACLRVQSRPVLADLAGLMTYLERRGAAQVTAELRALFLDRADRLISDELVGCGDAEGAPLVPGRVLRRAIAVQAAAIILVRSDAGLPSACETDIATARRVQNAAEAVDIRLQDHVVVGPGSYASLREHGLMERDASTPRRLISRRR